MDLILNIVREMPMSHIVALICGLNILLTIVVISIFILDRSDKDDVNTRIAKCENAIMTIKDYVRYLENDNSLNSIGIEKVNRSLKIMEESLARFAPPLDKEQEHRTINIANFTVK